MVTGAGYRRKQIRAFEIVGNKKSLAYQWYAKCMALFDRAAPAGCGSRRDQQLAYQPSGNAISGQAI